MAGIGLHDRAYGPLDNLSIGGIPEADWLALTQAGFATTWADPAADLIVKLHLQRLTSYGTAPERQAAATVIAPWPFGVAEASGYLVGYQHAGYPAVLEPVLLPYRVQPEA